jgi:hypothetical protein
MAMSNPDTQPTRTGALSTAQAAPEPGIPSFVQHHGVARALIQTFQEAIGPQIASRGSLTRDELTRAFALMMENWPRTLPLFARTCRGCLDGRTDPADVVTLEIPAGAEEGRRRDFVTRLLFSSVSQHIPETTDPVTGSIFPRIILPGLQANLTALFYEKEWEAMNADARSILQTVHAEREEEVWPRVTRHATLPVLTHALFVRIMLRFKQFHLQRQSFIRMMTNVVAPRTFTFADEHFDQIFEALFGHLREEIRTELGRARMDVRYGDETAGHLMRIFAAFDKARQERALPMRTLGGGVKPLAAAQAARRR